MLAGEIEVCPKVIKVEKLCAGVSSSSKWLASLGSAGAERWAGATAGSTFVSAL
jgi:hypothetical protein